MFEAVLEALAEVSGCDRTALGAVVGRMRRGGELSPRQLLDRVASTERLVDAAQAAQFADLAGFGAAAEVEDRAAGCRDEVLVGRVAAVEVGAAVQVSTAAAQFRLHDARRAVRDHPQLLGLVGTGAVSTAGLRKVLAATDVLAPALRRRVDAQLAGEAVRSVLTPPRLEQAALRRVLAADTDTDAAAKRAAAARRARSVRLSDPVDGTACLLARLRAEEALAVFGQLDRTARGLRGDGDQRPVADLMADLLVESVLGVRTYVPPPVASHPPCPAADPQPGPAGDPQPGPGGDPQPGRTGSTTGPAPDRVAARAVEQPAVPASVVRWRSVDGAEPWLWSDPPPARPQPDPHPQDRAWDRLCADPPPHHPAVAAAGGTGAGDQGWPGRAGGTDRADADGPARRPGEDPAQLDHPAHAPPMRRLAMPVEVQVVIGAGTLLGLDDDPGLLRGYGAVPAAVVRDIVDAAQTGAAPGERAARTTLRALFCDPVDGRLVAMDTTARLFTGPLRQYALWRDQGCRLTGAPATTRSVDLDHVHEHRTGGTTSAGNAQSLGRRAHVLKDHPAVHVRTLPPTVLGDGLDHLRNHAPDIEWTLPTGRRHRSTPPPALGPGSRPTDSPADPRAVSVVERHLAALITRTP